MGYSAEVVRRARDRLAQAREDRASEDRQHLAEAYERVPRIREIDRELRIGLRSEEHTSELQSQSTISYAVFCVKKH